MTTIAAQKKDLKNPFDNIASPFLQKSGLPFASVLEARSIRQVFRDEDALFAENDLFSTPVVLWAFLAQTLRDGKGAACAAAVADIATFLLQTGQQPPSGLNRVPSCMFRKRAWLFQPFGVCTGLVLRRR